MTYDRSPVYVAATPEYVLDMIRDSHRQQSQFDPEADPDVELTFESSIAEWRSACDLVDWRSLGRALNEEFGLDFPDDPWRAALEPARKRTLRGVCELIASGALRPSIEPVEILGATCLPAGVFLAIRSLLSQAGADVKSIAPSTPLHEYTRLYPGVFLGPVSRLAPNALPDVRVRTPLYDLSIFGCGFGLLLAATGSILSAWGPIFVFAAPLMMAAGAILFLASWIGSWIVGRYIPPASVEFGNLRTFRDMVKQIAGGARATRAEFQP